MKLNRTNVKVGSRPLFGVSIFLQKKGTLKTGGLEFSSPFRGFYLSTPYEDLNPYEYMFSSPFRGFYLSTLLELYMYDDDGSRPLFGVSIFLLSLTFL